MEQDETLCRLESKVRALQTQLDAASAELHAYKFLLNQRSAPESLIEDGNQSWPMALDEYQLYGRQMILPEIGLNGQLKLRNSRVLVVGAGGLGCPALTYLVGAGVGSIGIVDNDEVELSNGHRQFLHNRPGESKVDSCIRYMRQLNPRVAIQGFKTRLVPSNAFDIFASYDIVLDCTDGPATRYLISDVAVALRKPVVSGSALKLDGQLVVLCHNDGPCYRCLFPVPPPTSTVLSCGEGGILGPVVGTIGVLQALACIHLLTSPETFTPTMLLFNASTFAPSFRTVRLRGRKADCPACGIKRITQSIIESEGSENSELCSADVPTVERMDRHVESIGAEEYNAVLQNRDLASDHVLLDVRDENQFAICALPNSHSMKFFTSYLTDRSPTAPSYVKRSTKLCPGGQKCHDLCRVSKRQ